MSLEKTATTIKRLITEYGNLYSEQLGINIKNGDEEEIFKWFLASLLFGKRISENIAVRTYREFERAGVLSPKAVLAAGWNRLVEILDAGGYVRYDFGTATKLLEISKDLLTGYGEEPLTTIHRTAKNNNELESILQSFKGIGPVTTNIFLRELRDVWKKADPEPLPSVKMVARRFNIDLDKLNRKTEEFIRLEAALIRVRKMGDGTV
ncbi:MAG: hypothetical protein COT45_03770 [bacterium (Candidatus Stahlbacteria) CG08_land_8_20_14_0_20_40_26]|nr:MAG: hypothetical protein COX49_04840 [bacterium (Candidatus Stahlbacteria) CG23_combo_of_CG06-09_8_20_14_all_40_9]PIS24713.1 MAG: hypothetical protein COT45_03770 [bacterium (Candidatus Stahlbacteria) CG08_land_8_20_14_0_20_40_26]